jgi:Trypsin
MSPKKVLPIALAAAYAAITVHGSTLLSGEEVPRGGLKAKSHRHDGSMVQTSRDNKNDATIHQVLKSNNAPIVHEERIVGGQNVAKEAFPWYVSSTGDMYCGASLIHEDVVLTAAHCFQAFKPGSVVTLGTHQRVPPDMVQEIEATGITRKITAVMGHPKYDDFNILYDYMLLKLDSPVKSVTPVELNTDEAVPAAGELVTVVGHGQTGFFSGVSIELLAVDIYTIPHERCSLNFAGVSEIDERTQMCASAPSFGKGPW